MAGFIRYKLPGDSPRRVRRDREPRASGVWNPPTPRPEDPHGVMAPPRPRTSTVAFTGICWFVLTLVSTPAFFAVLGLPAWGIPALAATVGLAAAAISGHAPTRAVTVLGDTSAAGGDSFRPGTALVFGLSVCAAVAALAPAPLNWLAILGLLVLLPPARALLQRRKFAVLSESPDLVDQL